MSRAEAHDPLAPFRLRDYRLFSAMVLLAAAIERSQSVAIGWDVYERTGSALALGTIGLVPGMPNFAFLLMSTLCGGGAYLLARRRANPPPAPVLPPAPVASPETKELTRDDVQACLAYAQAIVTGKEVSPKPPKGARSDAAL